MKKKFNEEDVKATYRTLNHEQETEIRIFPQNYPKSIFVNTEKEFIETCRKYNGKTNIYVGVNEREKGGTRDEDVKNIGVFLLDIDIETPRTNQGKKKPASQEELKQAEKVTDRIMKYVKDKGYKEPLKTMSGNGYHLWFCIPKIQVTQENRKEVRRKLRAVEKFFQTFNEDNIKIDTVSNPSRVTKVPGTLSVKGKPTPKRPHRLSKWINEPKRREDPKMKQTILSIQPSKIELETKNTLQKPGIKFEEQDLNAPCLATILKDPHPTHKQRVILGKCLSHHLPPKKAFKYIEKYNEWKNFDPKKTQIQVNSFYKNKKPKYSLPPTQAFIETGTWPGKHECDLKHYKI